MPQPKRPALGRGLDSLIPMDDVPARDTSAINEIEISRISPNPEQPRTIFDEEALEDLARSITELGIIQPLSLRKTGTDTYQIIAGERRYRAAVLAGLTTVPAYIRTANDTELTEMALIENIQREDLNAIEVALGFKKLIDTYSLTQDRLSERLGKKRSTIANHLRLLRLPAEIQLGLRDRRLDMGHARALLSVDNPKIQLRLYKTILSDGISVRRVEEMVRELKEKGETPEEKKTPAEKKGEGHGADYSFFRDELAKYFPTPVKFTCNASGKGSITLKFSNPDELGQLVSLFEKLKEKK